MSLHFVIDGYNIINHREFTRTTRAAKDPRAALLGLLKIKKLMLKNKVTVVFDGFSNLTSDNTRGNISLLYSYDESADEVIKKIVERAKNPKNIIVVSDDKEVQLSSRLNHARVMKVEDFLIPPKARLLKNREPRDLELTSTQARAINDELKRLWLK